KNEILNSSIAMGHSIKKKETQNIEDIIEEAEKRVYKHKLVESQSARSAIISSLVKMLREKLLETEAHSKRIKRLAVKMGRKLNLEDNKIDDLKLLANLHDIGKVGVPNPILLKPASLNKKEWKKVKKHSEIGYRIAQSCSQLTPISDAILYHHEWWDGSGYPRGLKKEEIPLISRIIAIIDAYDVMIHERPYTKTMNKKDTIHELKRRAGKQFDPHLVGKFIEIIKE
ncbi:MAG: HD-GYP domain-containing protein, partial [Nanobdellota archaeon]